MHNPVFQPAGRPKSPQSSAVGEWGPGWGCRGVIPAMLLLCPRLIRSRDAKWHFMSSQQSELDLIEPLIKLGKQTHVTNKLAKFKIIFIALTLPYPDFSSRTVRHRGKDQP